MGCFAMLVTSASNETRTVTSLPNGIVSTIRLPPFTGAGILFSSSVHICMPVHDDKSTVCTIPTRRPATVWVSFDADTVASNESTSYRCVSHAHATSDGDTRMCLLTILVLRPTRTLWARQKPHRSMHSTFVQTPWCSVIFSRPNSLLLDFT